MNDISIAFMHADIHRTGEGCCCPGHHVLCPRCPTHKEAYADELAEAKRLLQLIADNSLVDDACWTARYYFKDWSFADLASAPGWFRDAAAIAHHAEAHP